MKIVRKIVSLDDYRKKKLIEHEGNSPVTLAIEEEDDGFLHIRFHNQWGDINVSSLHLPREIYEMLDSHIRDVMGWNDCSS